MKYRKISDLSSGLSAQTGLPAQTGFTLIEILITLGIMAILLGLTLPFAIRSVRSQQIYSERDTFLTTLRQARTLAMDNRNVAPHGVYIASASFWLYEGPSYAQRNPSQDMDFARTKVVTIAGPQDINFARLSGMTSSVSFTLKYESDQSKSITINLNGEGAIFY